MFHPGPEHRVEEVRQVALALPGVRAQVEPRVRQPVPEVSGHPGQAGCSVVAAGPVSRSSTLMLPRVARE